MPLNPGSRPRPSSGAMRPRPAQTEATRRAAMVKARQRATPPVDLQHREDGEYDEDPRWQAERWSDEGPAPESQRSSRRRGGPAPALDVPDEPRQRRTGDPARLEPAWAEEVERESDARTSARYMERLTSASEALERERYGDALRMVQPVLKNLPNVGGGHEVAGIALYRLGQWRKAAAELEQARRLHPMPEQLPVLADCYRALRKFSVVEEIWLEIRQSSPAPAIMAEGRIVAAGALADQGKFADAIQLLLRVADAPKRLRDYHLKQWYVLADLYDRSGDIVRARNFFKRVAAADPRYADVTDRLNHLGRR